MVLPEFLASKLCGSFAHAHMLSFLDCHEMRHFFYHMLPPRCAPSLQDQKHGQRIMDCSLWYVKPYDPITFKDCLMYFDPVTQVYQQVEPVTTCEHGVGVGGQRVDLKSASQGAGSWDSSSFEKLNSFKQAWLKWQRPIKGGRGSWMAISTCLSFLSFLKNNTSSTELRWENLAQISFLQPQSEL